MTDPRAAVLAGYDMAAERLAELGETDMAEVVRQLKRAHVAEVDHLERALALLAPMAVPVTAPGS